MPRRQPKLYSTIIVAIALFIFGKIIEHRFDHKYTHDADTYSIQQTIKDQQNDLIHNITNLNDTTLWSQNTMWSTMDSLAKKDFLFYLYKDSNLVAWSTHTVSLDIIKQESPSIIQLSNGWFLQHQINIGQYTLKGISLIKEQYEYQNKFLTNRFADDFKISHTPLISLDKANSQYVIFDINNQYLFSLNYNDHDIISPISIAAFIIYTISFAILILLGIGFLELYKLKEWSNRLLVGIFVYYTILCLLFKYYAIPTEFNNLDLFSPVTFAVSDLISSLGSLLIFAIFLLSFAFCYYRYHKAPKYLKHTSNSKYKTYFNVGIHIALIMALLLFINAIVNTVVMNSSQASIFFNIEDLNAVALYKLIILCLFYCSIIFILERYVVSIKAYINAYEFVIISCIIYGVLYFVFLSIQQPAQLINFLVFIIIGLILFKAHRNSSNGITYSSFIWVIFIVSFYAVTLLYTYNIEKEKNNREVLIDNLSFQLTRESDPVAEMYLTDIESKIKTDENLIKLLSSDDDNASAIKEYLEKTYFYGYWKRYDIEIIVCWQDASLYIETEDITTNCYNYFDDLIHRDGHMLNQCENFYFLDNDNVQVSYFAKIPYLQDNPNKETTLYIEINSSPIFSGLGYPELLQGQEEQVNNAVYKNYSFAKYIDNKLVKQYGTHRYPIDYSLDTVSVGTKTVFSHDNMVHLVYQLKDNTTLVLSRPEIKRIYLLMSFSLFALLFLIFTAILFFITRTHKNQSLNFSIQEKIQIAFVSLMVIILLVMGVSSVFYSIHQFKQKNNQMLSQRIMSVLQEMEQKIVNEPMLDESFQDYLQYLMQKFSNVFYSDINLYNTDGHLLATSRPELYQQGLSGTMMNPQAYYILSHKYKTEFIHEEYIGKLHFTSAYVPIYNYKREVLAFLNLPYFVGNNELKTEISSLIVAVINAYLLFVLVAIGMAVIISRRITRPLFLIQDRLAQIRVDKMNQKIGYKGNDEVGRLVKEYNRMVDEISESAEKLAKSEREMAWREMAKQIAHEIKNPLTPMKLSVQYLTKAWDNQREDFDSFLKRVSQTLIEQIDQLHIIANEFSDFAKMPQAQRTKVNIIEKLTNTAALYEKSEPAIRFIYDIESPECIVFADPDQLISVFNNVIKNAVQAIPNEKHGVIKVSSKVIGINVQISISDNGRGISDEVKSKIFTPNFTTKSSGMGLGLAIVKNIINNSGGKIWFETNQNIGTTFYLQLPISETD
ncbi:HAMP domain-containing histidine kinase [Carboxylicivirga sp. A043]|uniref:sensor histidine kinase n=1 Tax=Carboxylicivirga litoralis TaxID=2816963 RepID=UPI0021CB476B|nr:HAMP domain-containing sensor histidine kinase [Carboxylicivirga sp. A043]MCU4158245.1 HAMP domain-containing histidine kinase [Carboxylicivirga sp. A043]